MPLLVLPLIVFLLPLVAVVAMLGLVIALVVQVLVWLTWCSRGTYALVVYSDSPIWRDYFERHVLPALGSRVVVLNWSQRKTWRFSLAVMVFKMFAGTKDFNPMAIVLRPFCWPERFRFHGAFKKFKRGDPEEVEELRAALFARLEALAPADRKVHT